MLPTTSDLGDWKKAKDLRFSKNVGISVKPFASDDAPKLSDIKKDMFRPKQRVIKNLGIRNDLLMRKYLLAGVRKPSQGSQSSVSGEQKEEEMSREQNLLLEFSNLVDSSPDEETMRRFADDPKLPYQIPMSSDDDRLEEQVTIIEKDIKQLLDDNSLKDINISPLINELLRKSRIRLIPISDMGRKYIAYRTLYGMMHYLIDTKIKPAGGNPPLPDSDSEEEEEEEETKE